MSSQTGSRAHELGTAIARPRSLLRGFAEGVRSVIVFVWKWLCGVVLCLGPLASVVVVGWTLRFMQRVAYRSWWHLSGRRQAYAEALRQLDRQDLVGAPNWIVDQSAGRSLAQLLREGSLSMIVRDLPSLASRSLLRNVKLGISGLSTVALLTLPAGALWLFAWYAGWNNSFHKGYEQAWVGPTTGIAGIALFALVMLYVPLAQARQAATGSWRAFFQFRVVRAMLRERWAASAILALGYGLASFPVMIVRAAPTFLGNDPAYDEMSDAAVREAIMSYWFAVSLWFFPVYLGLRLVAAHIYATALARLVQRSRLGPEELHTSEAKAFETFGLRPVAEGTERPVLMRAFRWSGSRLGRVAALTATFACWVGVSFQVYVVEFFNYHPVLGWLNHPLIHLPWMAWIPAHLGG